MSAHALVTLSCPHCHCRFPENAKRVRPGGSGWCPQCEAVFPLDESDEGTRRLLAEAKLARQRRKARLQELQRRWNDPAPARPAPAKPLMIADVLRTLDELLLKLDGTG